MVPHLMIIRVFFFLDCSELLLIAALLSKDMDKITKSDLLWRLTTTDPYNMSAMVILANRHNVLTTGPEYGLTPPTDGQAAEGATPTTPPTPTHYHDPKPYHTPHPHTHTPPPPPPPHHHPHHRPRHPTPTTTPTATLPPTQVSTRGICST